MSVVTVGWYIMYSMNSSAWLCTVSYLDLSLGWQLTLLHINDIHVRIDETNKYSTKCKVNTLSESNLIYNNCFVKEKDQEARSCYGGPARVQAKVKEYIRFFKEKNQEGGSCYGGLARVQSKVKEYKDGGGNVLWLNAGDFFQERMLI